MIEGPSAGPEFRIAKAWFADEVSSLVTHFRLQPIAR